MLETENHTPFAHASTILLDRRGSQIWVVVVKATYRLAGAGGLELDPQQEPVCFTPVYAGAPGASSLLREVELVPDHPGTDVTLNAAAHAPGGRAVPQLDVAVAVGPARRALRVFGDRRWTSGALGPRATAPEPFTTMPVTWERAYGGEHDPRNRIGRGRVTAADRVEGTPLPNVEDPKDLVDGWRSSPAPAGLGAVPAAWSPRRELAGTFDDAWRTTRAPLWPEDHDPRFFRSAPAGLALDRPLARGETVTLQHLSPEPILSFALPDVAIGVTTKRRGAWHARRVNLDRVILEPDRRKVVMVWRSSLDCGARASDVEASHIDTKEVRRW